MKKVLFVCLGNICRSPAAEGIFESLLEESGLTESFFVDSAGTASYHIGERADSRMRDTAEKHGVVLNSRARQFTPADADEFDYVVAMDESNKRNINSVIDDGLRDKVLLLRDFDPIKGDLNVPDPYYGGMDGFENTYSIIERSLKEFLQSITEKN